MSRRRTSRARKGASLSHRLSEWRETWPMGVAKRETIGWALLILSALTLLGLSRISSGALLSWWATTLRQLFGWGAYVVALGTGILGLRMVWRDLDERLPFGPATVVGVELLLLVILVTSHVPLVARLGADGALWAAEEGRAGGYVGWALSVPLMEGLGPVVAAVVLAAMLLLALGLVLPISWGNAVQWGRRQTRVMSATFRRWQTAQQGTPIAPEVPEIPWWEEEPAPSDVKPRKSAKPARRSKKRAAKRRAADGSLPSLDLLEASSPQAYGDADVRRKTQIIEETLSSFGVPVRVVEVNQGPSVTQFGLEPGYIERGTLNGQRQRVRVAQISSLSNDLALALAAAPIRIEAPVPGRSIVGLEVPNSSTSLVSLRGVIESPEFRSIDPRLALALGEDVSGHPVAIDLNLMPHLLIAGATGSGKSVCINAIICCLLCNNKPDDLRMLMVDPKMVELIGYNDIPHLLVPVVVDVEQVVGALAWVTRQMDERYKLLHGAGVRNIEEYNRRMNRRKDKETLPTLVVFIDELADMMMVAPDDVERHICRVAQMGRATGIHLVIATQRPSVDVVTGLIKANFPARISFAVTSQVDSRVILDQGGAESLLGRGDMLFMSPQQAAPLRLQGCFVSDPEIERLAEFWRKSGKVTGQAQLFPPWSQIEAEQQEDALLEKAMQTVDGRDRVSTSFLQRQLRIGFPRAARLMDQLEEEGVVGPDEGGGRGRQVLVGRRIDFDKIEERLPGVEPT
jgi:S-DNA-T family DNA segregation ATPase FtsK/SpoIIIE